MELRSSGAFRSLPGPTSQARKQTHGDSDHGWGEVGQGAWGWVGRRGGGGPAASGLACCPAAPLILSAPPALATPGRGQAATWPQDCPFCCSQGCSEGPWRDIVLTQLCLSGLSGHSENCPVPCLQLGPLSQTRTPAEGHSGRLAALRPQAGGQRPGPGASLGQRGLVRLNGCLSWSPS